MRSDERPAPARCRASCDPKTIAISHTKSRPSAIATEKDAPARRIAPVSVALEKKKCKKCSTLQQEKSTVRKKNKNTNSRNAHEGRLRRASKSSGCSIRNRSTGGYLFRAYLNPDDIAVRAFRSKTTSFPASLNFSRGSVESTELASSSSSSESPASASSVSFLTFTSQR